MIWDSERALDEGDGTVLGDELSPAELHARFCKCLTVPDEFGSYDPCDLALQYMEEQEVATP